MQIDHVIYATPDLDATAARLEAECGLTVSGGGRHEGIGTHNRVIALGGGYLELLAIADTEEAAASDFGRAVAARIEAGEGLMGWAVAVADAAAEAERVGASLSTIARKGLTASLAGVERAMAEPCLPFFIERDPGSADPGAEGDAGGIRGVEVSGDAECIREWLGPDGAALPVRVVEGEPALRSVAIGAFELR